MHKIGRYLGIEFEYLFDKFWIVQTILMEQSMEELLIEWLLAKVFL